MRRYGGSRASPSIYPLKILGVTVGNEYILSAPWRGNTIINATTWLITDYNAHLIQLTTTTSNGGELYLVFGQFRNWRGPATTPIGGCARCGGAASDVNIGLFR